MMPRSDPAALPDEHVDQYLELRERVDDLEATLFQMGLNRWLALDRGSRPRVPLVRALPTATADMVGEIVQLYDVGATNTNTYVCELVVSVPTWVAIT